ncbi:MAG: DNA polymerase III subunit delta [Sulfurimonas sp.]|jgi:DNA polymerase-3 subunit delta|nr:DNA polymerase III subunit delta [Sulfurimonadaceae bacterium]
MYKNELDRHIKNSTISNSFILFGESDFFIDEYIDKLTPKGDDVSLLKLYFDEFSYEAAKAHLSQASLFGDRNILLVKSDKKIPKKELETLVGLCEKDKNNFFIYGYSGDDYSTYKNGVGKTSCMSVRFFHPNRGESIAILKQKANDIGLDITPDALAHLLDIEHLNIPMAINELSKLSIYNKPITQKDVDQLTFGLSEASLNEMLKKIFAKKEYKDDLKNLLEHSNSEIEILGSIVRYFLQLTLFHIYIKEHGSYDAKAILGFVPPKFVTDEIARVAIKIKLSKHKEILSLLIKSDLLMKSSKGDKETILICAIDDMIKIL